MSSGLPTSVKWAWLPYPSGIFGLTLLLALIFTQGPKLLIDGDTYIHIRSGEWMLDHGRILASDIFSNTVPGNEYVAHEWGAQLLMGWLHRTGGLPAVAIFFAWLAAVSLTILYRLLERLRSPAWLNLTAVTSALLLAFPVLLARPHLFTWLFGAITLDLLHRQGRSRWLLPMMMIPWANLHGGFILGLALQGIFIVGKVLDALPADGWREAWRDRHKDIFVLLVSVVASFCNPFGVASMLHFLTVSSAGLNRYNPEWLPPDFQNFWPLRVYLAALLTALLCARHRPAWTSLLLLTLFLDAALSHRRHVSLAVMFLLPLWTELLNPHLRQTSEVTRDNGRQLQLSGWSGLLLQTTILVVTLASVPLLSKNSPELLSRHFPLSERFPDKSWNRIQNDLPAGRMFNDYNWGAFVIYRTSGKVPVFIDGFADKYGETIYQDYYKIILVEKEAEELLGKYRIDWIFFPSDAPLLRYLLATGRWEKSYRDDQASVLTRRKPQLPR